MSEQTEEEKPSEKDLQYAEWLMEVIPGLVITGVEIMKIREIRQWAPEEIPKLDKIGSKINELYLVAECLLQ